MPKAGIQSASSTNWKSALVRSKRNQSTSETNSVMSDVHNARNRALRATASASPRRNRISAAPTSGRKVTTERMGHPFMARSPEPEQVPADQQDDADQHGKGVVIDIARLEAPGAARQHAGHARNSVGPEPVDDGAVAALPQAISDPLGRPHEEEVVQLVEIPFVEQEHVKGPDARHYLGRQPGGR